ncbi:MAG: hypothetical protein ACLS3T_04460 [Anaerobutyricum sp.]
MVKGIMCAECCYLDKTRKQNSNNGTSCFRYGCNARTHDKFIYGWIRNDNELKTMGCSDCNKIKVGTSFLLNGTNCFYCGSIQTKNGKRYLVYNASTYVSNGFYVDVVEQKWFSEHIKDIIIEYQTKEQIESLKQTARFYKKRIIKREEENS